MFSCNTFENASIMLEVCRGTYEQCGFTEEAQKLKGLEATSHNTAHTSLLVLRGVRVRDQKTAAAKRDAEQALVAALKSHPHLDQRLAS